MYDKFQFTNNVAQTVDFLMAITSSGYIALTDCHYEVGEESTDRSHMEGNASWATFTYYTMLHTYIEADVLADTPQNFHTFWHGTLQKLMVAPTTVQTSRTQGTLTIRPAGITEDWTIPVVVESAPTIPRGGLSPSGGKMTMTFKSFRPYFYRNTSADYVWHV
jgi:hypothetical protein